MSAEIIVQSGISAGTRYWIERPVIRIGSDPQADVCLPSSRIAPHALTVEFRDGNYRVHARDRSASVQVNGQLVEPGSAKPFAEPRLSA